MRVLALSLLVVVANAAVAQDSQLVGNWKLVAFQSILDDDPPKDMYGARPTGILILTREGRMAAIITAETRKAGATEAERAELQRTMIACSGKYRVEGKEFVTTIDMSWNEVWNGTEQRRRWRIEGGKLLIESTPQPASNFPGRMAVGRLVWERSRSELGPITSLLPPSAAAHVMGICSTLAQLRSRYNKRPAISLTTTHPGSASLLRPQAPGTAVASH